MADPVEKLEAEVRKLAATMKKLAADQAEMRGEMATKDELNELRREVADGFDAQSKHAQNLERTTQAMADAMMQAIKQLGVDKSVEARVARLEAAVFGSKH